MTARPYYVHGIELVNVGNELCDACGRRKAIGASVSGHLLCPRCAGLHSQLADELAQEKEASERRRAGERERVKAAIEEGNRRIAAASPPSTHSRRRGRQKAKEIRFRCGHSTAPANVFTTPEGWSVCRQCKREAQRARRRRLA